MVVEHTFHLSNTFYNGKQSDLGNQKTPLKHLEFQEENVLM